MRLEAGLEIRRRWRPWVLSPERAHLLLGLYLKEMSTSTSTDTSCTLNPYFKVNEGEMEAFKALTDQMVEAAKTEEGCLFYGFAFADDNETVYCREGYKDAAAVLAHLGNVGALIGQSLELASLVQIDVIAPKDQLELLREPTSHLPGVRYFEVQSGFSN